jgi:protein-L-isoaspartate(D-aspartate) O-methyltransferase
MSNFEAARKNMVDCQIYTNGVIDDKVLNAFSNIPREKFLPADIQGVAYTDKLLQIKSGHFLLDPMTHARMVQALEIKQDDVALGIGCGYGYSSAILAQLATTVIAIESSQNAIERASQILDEIDVRNVVFIKHKLEQGCKEHAPYNKIFLGGACAKIPETLVSQLAENGLMVFILKETENAIGKVTLLQKSGQENYSCKTLHESDAPYLNGFEAQTGFVF